MANKQHTALNRVLDHIQSNLEGDLAVAQLAEICHLSEFHFQRVFKEYTGEPVHGYVLRLRLEQAAEMLRSDPERPITQVAGDVGFGTASAFAKAFKKFFDLSASQWRQAHQRSVSPDLSVKFDQHRPVWTLNYLDEQKQIRVERWEPFRVAYVRNFGNYMGDAQLFSQLYQQLFSYGGQQGLIDAHTLGYNIYRQSPDITDHSKLEVMCAITLPEYVRPALPLNELTLAGGLYGVCRFQLSESEFKSAWQWLFDQWLARSGYALDQQRPTFERQVSDEQKQAEYKVDFCVPIKTPD